MGSNLPPIKAQSNGEIAQIGSFKYYSNQTAIKSLIDQPFTVQAVVESFNAK